MRRLRVTMDGQIAVLAVAEKGSFEAAGKYLGIGKSAVRKRVRGVEIELGTPIFRSIANGMLQTDAGGLYLPVARESVRHASLGVDRVRAFMRVQRKDLRIGYSSHLNGKLLAIISHLQLRPNDAFKISRESLLTHQVVDSVLQGDLNIGFGYLPLHQPDLYSQQLMEEPLMVCLPAGHPLGTKRAVEPAELDSQPFIVVGRKALPGRHEEIVTHFESLGIALNVVADAYLPREALWMVTQGIGLAIMTRSSVDSLRLGLIVRPLADRLLTLKSGVFIRREHDRSDNTLRQFVDRIWTETVSLRMSNHRSDRGLHP